MIMDQMIKALPEYVGARVGNLTLNAAAFADDLLLFASTPMGLQKLLDTASSYLERYCLHINAAKCMTVALKNVPHEKKMVIDGSTVFLCNQSILPALRRSNEWRYLGIPFTPEGRVKIDVTPELTDSLEKLTKVPLKPQQRLFALRTFIQPSLFYKLELGNINLNILRKSDRIIRSAVKKWLNLPLDSTPISTQALGMVA